MEIKSEVRGVNSGQHDITLYIEHGGERIAYLDFSEYEGRPAVQMLWVDTAYRRQGYGGALLRELQSRYPHEQIDLGTLSQDGAGLISSLSYRTVTDPHMDRLARLRSRVIARLQGLSDLPDDQKTQHSEYWNRLHDIHHELNDRLYAIEPTRSIIEQQLDENVSVTPWYHSLQIDYAAQALRDNKLLATSSQRFWGDGRRRKDNEADYQDSYWMKGISLTRDIRFAIAWSSVTFVLNSQYIRNRIKVVPFSWNYQFGSRRDHKKEREEFAIIKRTPDTYIRDEEDGGGMDVNRFVGPEGELPNLNQYLMGILLQSNIKPTGSGTERDRELDLIMNHPRFIGWVDPKTGRVDKKKD